MGIKDHLLAKLKKLFDSLSTDVHNFNLLINLILQELKLEKGQVFHKVYER